MYYFGNDEKTKKMAGNIELMRKELAKTDILWEIEGCYITFRVNKDGKTVIRIESQTNKEKDKKELDI